MYFFFFCGVKGYVWVDVKYFDRKKIYKYNECFYIRQNTNHEQLINTNHEQLIIMIFVPKKKIIMILFHKNNLF